MGICSTMPKYRVVKAMTLFAKDKVYGREKVCKVRKRNASKKITGYQEYELVLVGPREISSFKVDLEKNKVWVSSCSMAAVHLKDQIACQDRYRIMVYEESIFLVIFDGYGIAGDQVSEICVQESEKFFFDNFLMSNVRKK